MGRAIRKAHASMQAVTVDDGSNLSEYQERSLRFGRWFGYRIRTIGRPDDGDGPSNPQGPRPGDEYNAMLNVYEFQPVRRGH